MAEPDWAARVKRAEIIIRRWFYDEGVIPFADAIRLIHAEYHYFVVFKDSVGSQSAEGYGTITDAKSHSEAVNTAYEVYGSSNIRDVVPEWLMEPEKYPMGEISRHSVREDGGDKVRS